MILQRHLTMLGDLRRVLVDHRAVGFVDPNRFRFEQLVLLASLRSAAEHGLYQRRTIVLRLVSHLGLTRLLASSAGPRSCFSAAGGHVLFRLGVDVR